MSSLYDRRLLKLPLVCFPCKGTHLPTLCYGRKGRQSWSVASQLIAICLQGVREQHAVHREIGKVFLKNKRGLCPAWMTCNTFQKPSLHITSILLLGFEVCLFSYLLHMVHRLNMFETSRSEFNRKVYPLWSKTTVYSI